MKRPLQDDPGFELETESESSSSREKDAATLKSDNVSRTKDIADTLLGVRRKPWKQTKRKVRRLQCQEYESRFGVPKKQNKLRLPAPLPFIRTPS